MIRSVEVDRNGLEVLDRRECLKLLATTSVGRVGLSSGALPTVLPVTFRLDREHVVLCTRPGSKLDLATHNAVVAFEADDIHPDNHSGWSVVVTGVAREVDAGELAPEQRSDLTRCALGRAGTGRVIAISTGLISGRRMLPARLPARRLDPSAVSDG